MDMEKIGKFISKKRKEQNLTQEKLAEKLCVSKNAVSKWERGLNLPDVSLMNDLCKILDISLNELFAGEKINKDILKKSEKNIFEILKLRNKERKKYKNFILVILVIFLIMSLLLIKNILVNYGFIYDDNLKYSKVYIVGEDNIKGNVDINEFGKLSIDFDIGANKYGMAVFKNPSKAFKRLKKDYSQGIKLIQNEFNLLPLNNFTFRKYKTYGWQVTKGTKKEKEMARFVTEFLDIYENSFN